MRPEPYVPPYDPYPYSFTDSSKLAYPKSLYGAQRFVQDARALWVYETNAGARYPSESAATMRGDCDDFAVMLAFYVQEYFGYDTFVVLLMALVPWLDDHGCAFVSASSGVAYDYASCSEGTYIAAYPTGAVYYPLDWTVCPDWTIETHGWFPEIGGKLFEWYELAGNPQLSLD